MFPSRPVHRGPLGRPGRHHAHHLKEVTLTRTHDRRIRLHHPGESGSRLTARRRPEPEFGIGPDPKDSAKAIAVCGLRPTDHAPLVPTYRVCVQRDPSAGGAPHMIVDGIGQLRPRKTTTRARGGQE